MMTMMSRYNSDELDHTGIRNFVNMRRPKFIVVKSTPQNDDWTAFNLQIFLKSMFQNIPLGRTATTRNSYLSRNNFHSLHLAKPTSKLLFTSPGYYILKDSPWLNLRFIRYWLRDVQNSRNKYILTPISWEFSVQIKILSIRIYTERSIRIFV